MEKTLSVEEFGAGAALVVWGFRAAAINHIECPALVRAFDDALSAYGKPIRNCLAALARELGQGAGRRLTIACPGCAKVTADELSVVAMIAAASAEDEAEVDCHLAWLTAGVSKPMARNAALAVGALLKAARMEIEHPSIQASTPLPRRGFAINVAIGQA